MNGTLLLYYWSMPTFYLPAIRDLETAGFVCYQGLQKNCNNVIKGKKKQVREHFAASLQMPLKLLNTLR
jgi:hypothetical protein